MAGPLTPGSRVSESALSKELGTSRAPVREAIQQLISEGLVEQLPNAGTFVTRPDRIDVEDVYQIREWLESVAVADAVKRITAAELAELERACEESRAVARQHRKAAAECSDAALLYRQVLADLAFHTTLARACGNRRVVKTVSDNCMMSQVWGFMPEREDLHTLAYVLREHTRILRCVRRRDAQGASEAMRQHIRRGRQQVLARYDWKQRQLAMDALPDVSWSESLGEKIDGAQQHGNAGLVQRGRDDLHRRIDGGSVAGTRMGEGAAERIDSRTVSEQEEAL
jgi:DNA-binding GntR family transcriptional regulator